MVKMVETQPGEAMRRGVRYEVASGDLIPNLGEKCFTAVGEDGQQLQNPVSWSMEMGHYYPDLGHHLPWPLQWV